ncbi:MAG: oligosaccharide flippase family protein [Clostridia bacterium]|nr:oligosaccharide flippase family protein [Clostridia bacterium]
MKRGKRFLFNGLVLACSSVFLRGVGLVFNAYLTNQIGAEGIGLFGLVMSVYLFATTLANSGVSLAATRLVTEELSVGCDRGIRKSMRVCLLYTLFFGLLSGGVLFVFAEPLGRYFLDDARAIRSLRALSVSMPFIALSSAMNGYFQAVRRVMKSALAQVFEIGIKILVTVLLLRVFLEKGIEFACFAVVLGGSIAELCSCFLLQILYRLDLRRYRKQKECEGRYFLRTVKIAVPVAVSAYLRSGLVTLEHLLVPRGLKKFGASGSASLAQYGVVHGMVMPLLLFPAAILSAFGGLLVPELTEFQKLKRERDINRVVSRAIRLSLLFGIGAAGIFFAFAYELGMAIYDSGDAGLFIRFLAPLVIVMYTDSVTDFMLKGLNQQVYSMAYNIVDSAVSVALLYTVLPCCGINGYIAVIFLTEILNAFLSINRLILVTGFRIRVLWDVFVPLIFSLAAAYGVKAVLYQGTVFSLVLSVLSAVFIYLFLSHIFRRKCPQE